MGINTHTHTHTHFVWKNAAFLLLQTVVHTQTVVRKYTDCGIYTDS
jgi:predicted component of type VI protein secretion system